MLERLTQLSSIFPIDICAYAVMSNHYHLVLHVDRARAKQFTQSFTSIYQRIREIRDALSCSKECEPSAQIPLMRFQSDPTHVPALPYRLQDYLALVDWTGRAIREDKRGAIDGRLPPIIQRLNIDPDAWQLAMQPRGNVFGRAMGRLDHLRLHAKTLGQSWIKGLRAAEVLYN